jgi:hypothetical protein
MSLKEMPIEPTNLVEMSIGNDRNNQARITPDEFQHFSYSKTFHIPFLSESEFDVELFDEIMQPRNSSIRKYQCLLIFSLLKTNFKNRARILIIGETDMQFNARLHDYYDVYCLPNIELLFQEFSNKDLKETWKANRLPYSLISSFDCILTTSGFDHLPFEVVKEGRARMLLNIEFLLKPGGVCFFTFSSSLQYGYETMNEALYSFYKYDSIGPIPFLSFLPIENIASDDETLRFSISQKEANENLYLPFSYNIFLRRRPLGLPSSTQTSASYYWKKSPVYLFHHLIKCGGSSLVISFDNWFIMEIDHLSHVDELNRYVKMSYNANSLSGDSCIYGHYHYNGIYLHQRYPEFLEGNPERRVFTFMRNPLKLQISLYYYSRQRNELEGMDLLDFLTYMPNYISTLFPCNENNYKEVMDNYFFIGIVERMQESIDTFARLIGKKTFEVKRENVSFRDSQIELVTEDVERRFIESNKLDYLIYEYCCEKFDNIEA